MVELEWYDGEIVFLPPLENGDGVSLTSLAEVVFEVRLFNCSDSASGAFIDVYPRIYKAENFTVFEFFSAEQFHNFYVCNQSDPVTSLLSWMNLHITEQVEDPYIDGVQDNYWVSVKNLLQFFASGLLIDAPSATLKHTSTSAVDYKEFGLTPVTLADDSITEDAKVSFAYPAGLFRDESYQSEPIMSVLKSPAIAVSLWHCLSVEDWSRLKNELLKDSVAQKISEKIQPITGYFEKLREFSKAVSADLEAQWHTNLKK